MTDMKQHLFGPNIFYKIIHKLSFQKLEKPFYNLSQHAKR